MARKLFNLEDDPMERRYMRASRVIPDRYWTTCPVCSVHFFDESLPVEIEWDEGKYDPGNVPIGDFTCYCRLHDFLVTERVRRCFDAHSFQCVEFRQDFEFVKPKKKRISKHLIELYEELGPTFGLWRMVVTGEGRLNLGRSQAPEVSRCAQCGRIRQRGAKRIVVDRKTWDGSHVFRIAELPIHWALVTSDVKRVIESEKFSNILVVPGGIID